MIHPSLSPPAAPGELPADASNIILEAMSQGVVAWDADLTLTTFNRRYVELMRLPDGFVRRGISYAEVVRKLAERGHFGPNADPEACVSSRLESTRLHSEERHVRYLSDGRVLEVQRRPLPGGGFVSTFTDITEAKRAEAEVEHKSTLLSATLNVMDEGLAIFDRELRLQLFNDAFVRILGYPSTFVTLGMTYEQLLSYALMNDRCPPERARNVIRERIDSARHGQCSRVTHRRRDGAYIAIARAPLPGGGFAATYTDITEQVAASSAVKKTSALLKATQENMVQGIVVYDHEYRIINLNRRFLDIYKVPDDIARIGADFFDTLRYRARRGDFGPGDPAELAEIRIRRHKDPSLRHFEHRSPDGRTILMLRSPLEDGSGFVTTCTDVTQQRKAEQEIQRQAELLRSTFDAISQGIVVYDADFHVSAWNARYIDLFGFPPGFIRPGRTREEIMRHLAEQGEFGDCDVDAFVRSKRESAARNEHYRHEYMRPDGTALSIRREPMPGGGCVTTVDDVTRQRAREERIRESEERYALAMKGANEGLWDWNVARDEVYLSPRVREIANLDFMAPQISAKRWPALIHPEDVARYQAAVRAHFAGETELFQCEYRIKGKDDCYRWVLDRGLALRGHDGRVHRMAGSISDISARKDAEQRMLEAKEAAELASRAKTDFLANVSHELRTPLNAIIGFSEVMTAELFGPIGNARYREYLRDIHESGTHLLCLINDILDVAKAEAGKMELIEEVVDLRGTVEACVRLVHDRAVQEKLTIAADFIDDLPSLWADQRKLRQVLLNLLTNSIKFTPPGGTLTVSARTDPTGAVVLVVRDTGIGIAPEDMPKAMAPFGQVDSSLSRRHNGTGLGLPLTRALVEAHGGTFSITSEVGTGTSVTIAFPPERRRAQTARAVAAN
ncbi:MAG: PAS-domain containing protein [Gemmatimonas sp.]